MKILTKRNLLDFARKQPADRVVDLMSTHINEQRFECGCILCHYAVDKLGVREDMVHATAWRVEDGLTTVAQINGPSVFSIFKRPNQRPYTYGDLQRLNPPRPKRPSEIKGSVANGPVLSPSNSNG